MRSINLNTDSLIFLELLSGNSQVKYIFEGPFDGYIIIMALTPILANSSVVKKLQKLFSLHILNSFLLMLIFLKSALRSLRRSFSSCRTHFMKSEYSKYKMNV